MSRQGCELAATLLLFWGAQVSIGSPASWQSSGPSIAWFARAAAGSLGRLTPSDWSRSEPRKRGGEGKRCGIPRKRTAKGRGEQAFGVGPCGTRPPKDRRCNATHPNAALQGPALYRNAPCQRPPRHSHAPCFCRGPKDMLYCPSLDVTLRRECGQNSAIAFLDFSRKPPTRACGGKCTGTKAIRQLRAAGSVHSEACTR